MTKLLDIRFYSRRIAGIFILLIGLFISVVIVKTMWRDIPVWFFGEKVSGFLVEMWTENYKDDINPVYYFEYEFVTEEGEKFTGISRVPGDEWGNYVEGSELAVVYSPLNPSNNRLDDSRFVPFFFCSYIPFILFCWFAFALGREMIEW